MGAWEWGREGERKRFSLQISRQRKVMIQLISLLQVRFFCRSDTASVFDTKEGNNSQMMEKQLFLFFFLPNLGNRSQLTPLLINPKV